MKTRREEKRRKGTNRVSGELEAADIYQGETVEPGHYAPHYDLCFLFIL